MTSRFLVAAGLLAGLGAAAGCTSAGGVPAPSHAAPTVVPAVPASPASPPGGPAGVGASAARARGVFSGPFDAALRGPSRATAGRVTLTLVNVGTKADSYRITVRPAAAATISAGTASLASGAVAELDLRLTADVSVHVVSAGRGAEVADLPIELG
jgi:hypothetical protein